MADLGTFLTGDPNSAPTNGQTVYYDNGVYVPGDPTGGVEAINGVQPVDGAITLTAADIGAADADDAPEWVASSNLLNPAGAATTSRIDPSTGALVTDGNFITSALLPVTAGGTYTSALLARKAFYDANGTFIPLSSSTSNGTWTAPAGAAFMRAQTTNANWPNAQINAGATLLPFEPYSRTIKPSAIPPLTAAQIPTGAIDPSRTTFATTGTNLINLHDADYGFTMNASTGELTANATYVVTKPVAVAGGGQMTLLRATRVGWFNAAGGFISSNSNAGTAPATVPVPALARSARFVLPTANVDTAIAVVGSTLPAEWTAGGVRFTGNPADTVLNGRNGIDALDLDYSRKTFTLTRVPEALDLPVPPVAFDSNATFADYTPGSLAAFYAQYDALVTAHPGYVTSTQIGTEASVDALPIHRYDFEPVHPGPSGSHPTGHIKIVVFSALHGGEKHGAQTLYNFFDNLCNHWTDDPLLEILRFNVHWVVVPVGNPGGWTDSTRANRNGVDLARNFPTDWDQNTTPPGGLDYGGTAPLSEPEAVAMQAVLEANKDALAFVDFHNYSGTLGSTYYFLWSCPGNESTSALLNALYRRMDRKWKPTTPWMHQDYDNPELVGENGVVPVGSPARQATAFGVPYSATFEHSSILNVKPGAYSGEAEAVVKGYEAWVNFMGMILARHANRP